MIPDWTAEVIWWVSGAGAVGLLLGWVVGRFTRRRVARLESDQPEVVASQDAESTAPTPVDEAANAISRSLDELGGINASLKDELEAARLRYAELHGTQVALTANLDAAQIQVAELDHENVRLGTDLALTTERVGELDELQVRTAENLSAANVQFGELEGRTAVASDDLYLARARVSEVEGKLAAALTALRNASLDLESVHGGLNHTTPSADLDATHDETGESAGPETDQASIDLRVVDATDDITAAAAAADAAAAQRASADA